MTRTRLERMLLVLVLVSSSASARGSEAPAQDLIRRGEYLAIAGDCVACHTAPGGKPYAGGLALPTPLGAIVSTNITPSTTAGTGNYTLAQFTDAMRKGIRADGKHLYPGMPYTAYAKVTDEDMRALYAYFMHGVAPVDEPAPDTHLPFPFNVRLLIAAWNLLFLDSEPFVSDSSKSPEWNRGAYLTRGLTHCGACHTPRNLLMAERASRELGGGDVGAWRAPNITSDATSGIGGWSDRDLVDYMRHGRVTGKGQASGPMAEAIDYSLRHLTAADLQAIAVYLKTVPAIRDTADARPAYTWGKAVDELNDIRGIAWPNDPNRLTGAQLYDAYCATCHQAHAQGSFDGGLPPLFNNTSLGGTNTNNLVMVILAGIQRHTDAPEIVMPAFARELSDEQIATLGSYLTAHYGNPAAHVTAQQVKNLRSGGSTINLVLAARIGIAAAILVFVFALIAYRRRKSRTSRAFF
jgi:mono/diheme cytochrome c family protein